VVRRIEEFVERNLSANIHLEDLAAVASMSVDHFVRAFRQATGSTPHRYLLERRLDHASALLRTSTDRVSRIALRCGLSPAHFTATFHERHGMTPTEFRRMP
jgi:AraC family transcriptional regulator